jgi:hypothetical protein
MDNEVLGLQDAPLATNAEEKMLPQSEVNRIVGAAKAEAAERERRRVAEQMQAGQMQQGANQVDSQSLDEQINARVQQALLADKERQEAARQQAAEAEYKEELRTLANDFMSKVGAGKVAYEDFDAVTADLDLRAFPQLVFLSAGLENPADVVYELSKNPQKLVTIQALAEKSPQMAKRQLEALSNSIKANREAMENPNQTDAPLPRIKPSTTASADAGAMTIRDLRKQPWLKG